MGLFFVGVISLLAYRQAGRQAHLTVGGTKHHQRGSLLKLTNWVQAIPFLFKVERIIVDKIAFWVRLTCEHLRPIGGRL